MAASPFARGHEQIAQWVSWGEQSDFVFFSFQTQIV